MKCDSDRLNGPA